MASPVSSPALTYAHDNQQRFLEELKELLRIPSISTLPQHKEDMQKAADYCCDKLRDLGFEAEVIATQGHPLVYGQWIKAKGKPTVLCYGHYDVQPPDPLNEWHTPPFEPAERNGNIYARGAVDDKGQMYMHIKAIESLIRSGNGALPLNVRVLIEGEEEVGGEAIARFVRENPGRLKADFALVSDTELFAPDLPTLCVGLRGMVYTEVEASGPRTDLHSGMYGGAAPNPLEALCRIVAKLKNEEGKILIPGFYDNVVKPENSEVKAWAKLPFDEEEYRESEIGSKVLTGEPGYTVMERTWSRPTLEVHGIPGGFTSVGAKTVIPARAAAKISMRLVSEQKPAEIYKQFSAFVMSMIPPGIELKIKLLSSADPLVIKTDNRFVKAATEAMKEIFAKETVFIRSGGSIPIVAEFERHLKIPTVMMGFGLPDDNLHAPNEKFSIANFRRGIESIIRLFEKVGA